MIERFHRQLKNPLTATGGDYKWDAKLPLVSSAILSATKQDIGFCAAELVYETTLRFSGEIFDCATDIPANITNYAQQFKQQMKSIRTIEPLTWKARSLVSIESDKCSHIFVRNDKVQQPSKTSYNGLFKINREDSKTFTIKTADKHDTFSVDRVKPEF